MKTLYEIKDDYIALVSQIEAGEGEITPEMDEALTLTEKTLKTKAEGYVEYIGSRESFVSRIDEEIKRLQGLKKSEQSRVDYLKSKLVDAVSIFGDITLNLKTITTRPSQSVEVDMDKIHKDYITTKVSFQADKMKVKQDLKDGKEVKGAILVEKLNLRIK